MLIDFRRCSEFPLFRSAHTAVGCHSLIAMRLTPEEQERSAKNKTAALERLMQQKSFRGIHAPYLAIVK